MKYLEIATISMARCESMARWEIISYDVMKPIACRKRDTVTVYLSFSLSILDPSGTCNLSGNIKKNLKLSF